MSTDIAQRSQRFPTNYFVLVSVRVWAFPFVIFLPLRCFAEIIEGLSDILCLFKRTKAGQFMGMLEDIQAQIRTFGPLDLADVDVSSREAHVRVRLLMR
jgi:hypothetical protein